MIRALGHGLSRFFRAVMPDPFVLAVLLTFVTAVIAATVDALGPLDVARAWLGTRDRGVWSLLGFSMQMALILVTGHALAAAPVVARAVSRLASIPTSTAGAAALVATIAVGCSLLHWGLGLVVGALLARDVGRAARRAGRRLHYPLVCASGYVGMMTWHGGLSGSAPLKVTTQADLVELLGPELGARIAPMPFTDTVFGLPNLVITGGLLAIAPVVLAAMAPDEDADVEAPPDALEPPAVADAARSIPERLERSAAFTAMTLVLLGAALVVWWIDVGPRALDPNALNLAFLASGLALHGSVRSYLAACDEAVRGTAGIILQFPLYAGLMALITNTSLGLRLSGAFTELASQASLPVWTFGSASLVNLLVPSGGGQWAVQGPIAMRAALDLGTDPRLTVLAVAYGDQLTNMLQPFWALPLLGITGVKARDIVGYTAVVMLAAAAWIAVALYAFSRLAAG